MESTLLPADFVAEVGLGIRSKFLSVFSNMIMGDCANFSPSFGSPRIWLKFEMYPKSICFLT